MLVTILALFLFFFFVQVFFHLYVFSRTYRQESVQQPIRDSVVRTPRVSVIIAARNEEENLKTFLPPILDQEYPDFEVIVVNDRSEDDSGVFLEQQASVFPQLKTVTILDTIPGINPKKRAIESAIELADGEYLLCTDADCKPLSTFWIQDMVAEIKNDIQIVLGFSPYKKKSNFLNRFIQFETLYTAIQYFSFTKIGKPYMSVGRNFLYKRSLFFECGGFKDFIHMNGGDDDLLMAKMSTGKNTTVSSNPTTFVESIPEDTVINYIKQKHRHLSVGFEYSYPHKIALGLLNSSHILFYAFVFYSFLFSYFVPLTLSVLAVRVLLLNNTFYKSGKHFKVHFFNPFEVLLLDFLYAGFYLVMGIVSFFYRSRVWK